jgi:Fur family transcriptional regulator, ferric uptake regulator
MKLIIIFSGDRVEAPIVTGSRKNERKRAAAEPEGQDHRPGDDVQAGPVDLMSPWRQYLAKHHLKVSRIREEVVEVFLEMAGHVDLDQLHEKVKQRNPNIGLATVYRVLKLLEEAGIAEARHFGDRTKSYEVALGRGHHDHLICDQCGRILEFADQDIERLQEDVARAHKFVLLRHQHSLFGLCADCRGPLPPVS